MFLLPVTLLWDKGRKAGWKAIPAGTQEETGPGRGGSSRWGLTLARQLVCCQRGPESRPGSGRWDRKLGQRHEPLLGEGAGPQPSHSREQRAA